MHVRHFRYGSIALAIAALSACGLMSVPPKNTPEGLLGGTGWQLQQLGGQGAIAGSQPTLCLRPPARSAGRGHAINSTERSRRR